MNHNQTKSQTSKRLHQHPTPAEMTTTRLAYIRANIKEFSIFTVMAVICWLLVSSLIALIFGG
ncbi:hypothetical protein [Acinetobacter sp. Ver3]|uniref:hypothetical protein n=1 Tax=Acinetobacter sp. Ver3 TaxID=466088 RepID=UPI0012DB2219|nr:hypothetical protein [Acinetobacter sp. Ver3]